ncbi:hypothetical protein DL766_008832 [Monosporascus sp. MC13-8B]|uniref:RNA ligase domain-containing protein n=1 Tax=Monosporascus cannonballus TaxID=155416 RepID=A0ABY0GUJ6_9PEZI|nr:hypothetical protein DL762_009000 [Monosporascus cannonballus]RYO80957.1 hypothetical protein DL763_008732 [Monosporascus cannonballus]RYP17732.1 hypothetical protein DL766_008832 [Monosporascus sp. MC13-8B]
MTRKLVTVPKVAAVHPIKGADGIEVVEFDGWTSVAGTGQFKTGDLAVFFEVDSSLPASDPRWMRLAGKFITYKGERGFRVKSGRVRGQISQGILEPLDDFPEILAAWVDLEIRHGRRKAERLLRETAFECLLGINKTDQECVQNLLDVFEKWGDEIFQETVKVDGSSMTVYFVRNDSPLMDKLAPLATEGKQAAAQPNGRAGVCSRNVEKPESQGGYFWTSAKTNALPEELSQLNRNIALQGELCGSSIQKNFEGLPLGFHDFFVFAAWDIGEQRYMKPKETEDLVGRLGVKHVPILGYHRLGDIARNVQEILAPAEGIGINGKKREGIVLKHVDGRFSFKTISNSYLLKHGE